MTDSQPRNESGVIRQDLDRIPSPPHRIEGERIYLREMRTSDAEGAYHRWMNDAEVLRYTESRPASHTVESLKAYVEENTGDGHSLFLAIVVRDGDVHIGNIKVGPVNWRHRNGDLGIIIGEKRFWGRGFATEAIALMTGHCFETLGLHKVTAGCYAVNRGAVRAFEKAGFEIEGRRPSHGLLEGKFVDVILLGRINPAHE